MAIYFSATVTCDHDKCKSSTTGKLQIYGVNAPGDDCSIRIVELPMGWDCRRAKFWHVNESVLCPEHNK